MVDDQTEDDQAKGRTQQNAKQTNSDRELGLLDGFIRTMTNPSAKCRRGDNGTDLKHKDTTQKDNHNDVTGRKETKGFNLVFLGINTLHRGGNSTGSGDIDGKIDGNGEYPGGWRRMLLVILTIISRR